eukprot:1159282-Pelagomonas_calceolata.AAC.15
MILHAGCKSVAHSAQCAAPAHFSVRAPDGRRTSGVVGRKGKSTTAARLAELYHLKCISAKDLLAAKNRLPPDLLKVFESEMSGKEPRASAATMAALFREIVYIGR